MRMRKKGEEKKISKKQIIRIEIYHTKRIDAFAI